MSLLIGGMLLNVEIGARIMKWYWFAAVVIFWVGLFFGAWLHQVPCAKGETFTYAGSVYECVVKTSIGDE